MNSYMIDKSAKPPEVAAFLNLRSLPGRLNAFETARILGFEEHDIPTLVRAKVLKPLGNPARNAHKFFAQADVIAHRDSAEWLSRATALIAKNWQDKNRRKTNGDS